MNWLNTSAVALLPELRVRILHQRPDSDDPTSPSDRRAPGDTSRACLEPRQRRREHREPLLHRFAAVISSEYLATRRGVPRRAAASV